MFLVVTLHAALAYTQVKVPRLLWAVRDPSPHLGFDVFCWWAMGVSLPLFFLIGGFFAAELYESRGLRRFVANRTERILVPSLAAGLTFLPLSFFAWAYGWLVSGQCTWREIRRMRFDEVKIQPDLYGPAHLWFLEYLVVMLAAYGLARTYVSALKPGPRPTGWAERLFASPWKPLLLAVPTAALLWASRERVGLDAALDRHNTFLIDPLRLLHHGAFFAAGVWLQRFRNDLGRLARWGPLSLALSVPVFAGRAWLLRADWVRPLDGAWGVSLAVLAAVFAWLIVFGALGTAQRLFDRPRPVVRYLADSSYWVYLYHFPVVGLIQVDLYTVRLPTYVKFAVVLGLTLATGLASYQTLVRYTALGRWLHGRRDASPAAATGRVNAPHL